jgi:hypothetical protein
MPNGKCYHHGGATPSGLANPNVKHGRHSKDLPTRLAGRYEVAASDPELLKLDSEINLLDALVNERLATLDTGESGAVWRELADLWSEIEKARRSNSITSMLAVLPQIGQLVTRGQADQAARQEILDMIERRRKLVDSEDKRRVRAQQVMTAEQAAVLVSVMADSVRRHVDDPDVRAAIARDIAAVFGR